MHEARRGWSSDFARFRVVDDAVVLQGLRSFLPDAGEPQIRAWRDSIPPLQREVGEVIDTDPSAGGFTTILEYELPLDSRRADVVVLTDRAVVVIELKGKERPSESDIDQAAAYGRDLRHYHAACAGRPVEVLLVATRAKGSLGTCRGVRVLGPDQIDAEIARIAAVASRDVPRLSAAEFLSEEAYRPLPTIVQAARELFYNNTLRRVHRAHAATEPAVTCIRDIAVDSAKRRRRALVLIAGTPGSGKTLVGLRTVHAQYLDDVAVPMGGLKPTQPAVFLSGNGPLVEVLQYELRGVDQGGNTFVKAMFDFVGDYGARPKRVPRQHVIVFDEAQRAFDRDMVREKYARRNPDAARSGRSQPSLLADIAHRLPEWSVLVGLVGEGQHISRGEEGGIEQWAEALAESSQSWDVYAPAHLALAFREKGLSPVVRETLNLDTELRFHLAEGMHDLVRGILGGAPASQLRDRARSLETAGLDLRITRHRELAESYLRERYRDHAHARFGLIASSRDKLLAEYGVGNDFQSARRVRVGPWFGDDESAPGGLSCRHLRDCLTEFRCQGLELDAALLAWGNDFVLSDGGWDISHGSKFRPVDGVPVRNPHELRANSYRVLLTRGRDATVVWVPPRSVLDRTFEYLRDVGFREL